MFLHLKSEFVAKIANVGIPETPTPLELANIGNGETPPPLKSSDDLNGWSHYIFSVPKQNIFSASMLPVLLFFCIFGRLYVQDGLKAHFLK